MREGAVDYAPQLALPRGAQEARDRDLHGAVGRVGVDAIRAVADGDVPAPQRWPWASRWHYTLP